MELANVDWLTEEVKEGEGLRHCLFNSCRFLDVWLKIIQGELIYFFFPIFFLMTCFKCNFQL